MLNLALLTVSRTFDSGFGLDLMVGQDHTALARFAELLAGVELDEAPLPAG